MKDQKHSTILELKAFSDGTLSESESEKVGKHLLHCPDCRRSMPAPSKERLWATIMSEAEVNEILAMSDSLGSGSILSQISSFLKLQSGLLWSGVLLLILLSFTFLAWFNTPKPDREVVQVLENETAAEFVFPGSTGTPVRDRQNTANDPPKPNSNPKPRIIKTEDKKKIVQENLRQNRSEIRGKEQFSLTRGGSGKCQTEENLGLEFATEKDSFVFKWKKVQNAAKYHLYISDEDEILIVEYETASETTFTLKETLDPMKTYRWKIIVTLENGKKIIGASQKFKGKETLNKIFEKEEKRGADIRCSSKN